MQLIFRERTLSPEPLVGAVAGEPAPSSPLALLICVVAFGVGLPFDAWGECGCAVLIESANVVPGVLGQAHVWVFNTVIDEDCTFQVESVEQTSASPTPAIEVSGVPEDPILIPPMEWNDFYVEYYLPDWAQSETNAVITVQVAGDATCSDSTVNVDDEPTTCVVPEGEALIEEDLAWTTDPPNRVTVGEFPTQLQPDSAKWDGVRVVREHWDPQNVTDTCWFPESEKQHCADWSKYRWKAEEGMLLGGAYTDHNGYLAGTVKYYRKEGRTEVDNNHDGLSDGCYCIRSYQDMSVDCPTAPHGFFEYHSNYIWLFVGGKPDLTLEVERDGLGLSKTWPP